MSTNSQFPAQNTLASYFLILTDQFLSLGRLKVGVPKLIAGHLLTLANSELADVSYYHVEVN